MKVNISMRILLLAFVLTISLAGAVRADYPIGDLNGDCDVNLPDVAIFVDQWLDPPGCSAHPNDCADLDDANGIDMTDFALLAANWLIETGSLQVTILPQTAIDDGAQWRIDDGTWRDSGYTERCLIIGFYTVEYSAVADWNSPANEAVQISDGQTTTTTGTYNRHTGSLQVTISPQAAIDAGAQWQVDGDGIWRENGYIETGLPIGSHSVQYKTIIGWNEPNDETVQINDGQTTSTTGTYTLQTGSLQVTISPQAAIDAGAKWRLGSGPWRDSNDVESGLPVGWYAVEFNDINGWTKPIDQIVQINDSQTTAINGTYFKKTSATLIISEFMASNASEPPLEEGELLDGHGESSDWIEIYNPMDENVSLNGWYVTNNKDNLTKWQFPDGLQIGPGEFLIIFASQKTYEQYPSNYPYLDPGGYYHTNFNLDTGGRYLALVAPDGNTAVHEYEPKYPEQLTNISYGLAQYGATLVPTLATATYHVPTSGDAALGTGWTTVNFDDSSWDTGETGLGFGSAAAESGQDIGSPSAAGSYSVNSGVYTVHGDGEDIWGTTDDFYYVYTPLTGDGEIIARVVSMEYTNDWAKAGVMIREQLTDTSSHAMMIATPPEGATDAFSFEWVDGIDRDNRSTGGDVTLPAWVKIVRSGNDFTGYYASDFSGTPGNWIKLGTTTINMATDVYIGLCVTSHSDGVLCTAVFDNVLRGGRITTDVQQEMLGINASMWARIDFNLEEDQRDFFDTFILRMKHEDGFVAYLNGQEVTRHNAPNSVEWNSTADYNRPIENSATFEEINLMAFLPVLQTGRNVLAIHGLNDDKNNDEFLILPELVAASSIDIPQYFTKATPGTFNIADTKGMVSDVWFSHERGYYDIPFQLTLSTAMDDAEIRYTTDGSRPTITHGSIYTGTINVEETTTVRALAVRPGWMSANPDAHTYIFLFDVANQPKFPPGLPTSWAGHTADYEVDPEVVNNTLPGYSFEEALLWIPSLCITMPFDEFFSADDGIYVYSTSKGDAWERPASIELIYPDGRNGFQINAGVHMHGGASRNHNRTLKHSFRLVFRGIYGPTKLNFPLFPDSEVEQFDQLVVRGSSGDSWTYPDSYRDGVIRHIKQKAQYTRDPWLKDTQRAMGHHSANSIFVHLYLNGLYWGQYNCCERPNSSFQADYHGGDREEYDAIHDRDEVQSGTMDIWNQMFSLAGAGLADDEAAQLIQGNNPDGTRNPDLPILLNVDNLIDYMILHHFARSEDWPCHNYWSARRRGPLSEGFRFFVWDQENHTNALDRFITGCGCHIEVLPGEVSSSLRPAYLYAKLRENPMFRREFSDRVHRYMFNGGLLTPEKCEERWMKRATEVDKSVVAESARWADAQRSVPYKREVEFLTEQNWIRTVYWPQISAIVLDRYRGVGLYPDIQAPVFKINNVYQHGGQIVSTDELTMDNPNGSGTIYYTTDGNDPRLPESTQIDGTTLVAENASKKVLVPTASVNNAWKGGQSFNDSKWKDGTFISGKTGGVGYDENNDYKPYISYDVEDLMNADLNPGANTSCYIRIPFTFNGDPGQFNFMTLNIRYDDGFVAYLNGDELERKNFSLTATPAWNSAASGGHEASGLEPIPVSDHLNSLKQGDNILAIHGMNNSNTSSDFLISVELIAGDSSTTNGGISPSAKEYTGPLSLDKSTHIKACVLDDSKWSALNEATFAVGPVADNLRITEIMYHPQNTGNPNDPNEEFIELKNIGPDILNLNLVRFTEGINFTFPDVELASGEHIVVVKNRSAFEAQYGTAVKTAGLYTGSLANNGERIRLQDAIGQTILDFEYEDGWYQITDGGGFSLTIIEPTDSGLYGSDRGLVANWKFDEGSGGTAIDSTGGNNGTLIGDPTWTSGRIGGALSFDGAGDYVAVDTIGALAGESVTAQAWIRIDASAGTWNPILTQHDSGGDGYYFYVANNTPDFYIINSPKFAQATSPETLNADEWYHVAATNDGSNIKLYVNGLLKATTVSIGFTGTSYDAYIGCEISSPLYYSGLIDDVRIYDRPLSEYEFQDIADPIARWSRKSSWRSSALRNGSPGWGDSDILPNPGAVVINEVMSHSHGGPDWIELHNTTGKSINIGGWYLSDNNRDDANLMKYRIADGTMIYSHNYLVFYQDKDFNDLSDPGCLIPFGLSENEEEACLTSRLDPNNMLTGYREVEDFGAARTNVSFGRYFKSSTGNYNFVAMDSNTPGSDNDDPKVGPVVINEIMYNPPSGNQKEEYIELYNITATPVTLYRTDKLTPWKFTDGIEYTLPEAPPVTIPGYGYLLVVKDLSAFTARYGYMPPGVQVLESYDGWLSNAGEKLELSLPGDTDPDDPGIRYYIRTDRVNYSDGLHPEDCPGGIDLWPTEADGLDKSLSRRLPTKYGNDVANWKAASPSPGTANP